jgi:hypothetical protein
MKSHSLPALLSSLTLMVGEKAALGAGNVVRQGGDLLLTNPAAMMRWTLPFWILGAAQLIAGLALLWLARRSVIRAKEDGSRATP